MWDREGLALVEDRAPAPRRSVRCTSSPVVDSHLVASYREDPRCRRSVASTSLAAMLFVAIVASVTWAAVPTDAAVAATPRPTSAPAIDREGESVGPSAAPTSALPRLAIEGDVTSGTLETTGATWASRVARLTGPLDPAVLSAVNSALAMGA